MTSLEESDHTINSRTILEKNIVLFKRYKFTDIKLKEFKSVPINTGKSTV